MPTGQLFVWHARIPRQPIAWSAEFEIATPSAAGAGKCRHRRYRDVLFEDLRGGPRRSPATVEDDIIAPHLEGEIDIGLDVLRRQLEPDGDSPRFVADLGRHLSEVVRRDQVGEGWRADRGMSGL